MVSVKMGGVASAEMKKQVKKKLLNFGFCIISSAQDFGTGISCPQPMAEIGGTSSCCQCQGREGTIHKPTG